MERSAWSPRLIWRYTLLQLPAIILLIAVLILVEQWIDLPGWLSWGVVVLWIIKDIVLFPFTWRAYDWDSAFGNEHSMIGRRGIAKEKLSPVGFVQIGNELWQAELGPDCPPVDQGSVVRVRAVRGLTLLVEPLDEE